MDPFRRTSATTVHSWAVWNLVEVEVADPGGAIFRRTFVESPGAVGVVALSHDDGVWLVRQYRAAYDEVLWEIPAGLRDVPGEDPLTTASRELAEEVGLEAGLWEHIGRCSSAPGVTNSDVEIYLARDLGAVPDGPQGPEEEHMTRELVRFPRALAMIDDGVITDSKTVIGLLLAARRLSS